MILTRIIPSDRINRTIGPGLLRNNRAKLSSFEKLSLKTYGDCRLKLYMRDIVTPGHVT